MAETPTPPTAAPAPMTDAEKEEARRMQQQGMGVREIARRFNRAPSTISRILRERRPAARRAPARPTRMAGRPGAEVSRQEFRSLEQRIARIESAITRMASMLQPTRGRAGGRSR